MDYFINKLILLLLCSVFMTATKQVTIMVIAMLITVTASSLISFFQKSCITLLIFVLFLLLCALFPYFLYYFPLLCYDLFTEEKQPYIALVLLPLLLHFSKLQTTSILILLLLTGISYLMKLHYKNFSTLEKKYYAYRNLTTEMNMDLRQKFKNY